MERAGQYQEATTAYRTSLALLGPLEQADVGIIVAVARCLLALGQQDECHEWMRETIRVRPCEELWLEDALLIARRDRAEGIGYIESLVLERWRKNRCMTRFYHRRGEAREASAFAAEWLAELKDSGLTREPELIEAAEEIAPCYLDAGLIGAAEDLARMGVQLAGDRLRRVGYVEAVKCSAGSLPCRIVLAKIAIGRGCQQEAAEELAHARVLVRTSSDESAVRELTAVLLDK